MFSWISARFLPRRKACDLYGAVVAFARTPLFYDQMRVADTPEGRYEILVLHLFIVMERLRSCGGEGKRLSQELIDKFVIDMDDNIREMGVGDLSVPRKVKKAAAAFYDRTQVYRSAINRPDIQDLIKAIAEFMPSAKGYTLDAKALAHHVISFNKSLKDLSLEQLDKLLFRSAVYSS